MTEPTDQTASDDVAARSLDSGGSRQHEGAPEAAEVPVDDVDDPFAERPLDRVVRSDEQYRTAVATAAIEAAIRACDEVPLDREVARRYIDVDGKRARTLGFAYAGKDKFETFKAAFIGWASSTAPTADTRGGPALQFSAGPSGSAAPPNAEGPDGDGHRLSEVVASRSGGWHAPRMDTLSDAQVATLLPELAEAARATERTVQRFVPSRVGIVEEAGARRHQVVLGRRGVGKSSLLRRVEADAREAGSIVVFIDLETLRGITYPDVLIHLLGSLLRALDEQLAARSTPLRHRLRMKRTRREIDTLSTLLDELLSQPQTAEHVVRQLQTRRRSRKVEGSAGAKLQHQGFGGAGSVGAGGGSEAEKQETVESRFEKTKMDALFAAATRVRTVISASMEQLAETPGFIVLDDFYHVRTTDQPDVLGYLHQVVKNLEVYLKVCAVRHRLKPFVEEDPPRGLQLGHDADPISLDVTLEQFQGAQRFLEEVLAEICRPLNIDISQFITNGARERLVLASGGVARDYLSLVSSALRASNERGVTPTRLHNRVSAEDVNETAAKLSAQKHQDLRRDAGPNADAIRDRLDDVVRFCLDRNRTNVLLIEGTKLEEEPWGRDIRALADLRLLHEIGNVTIKNSAYRGRRFEGYTLDLSTYTGTRSERIRQIEFWKPGGKSEIRRTSLIYEPDWVDRPAPVVEDTASPEELFLFSDEDTENPPD